MGVIQVTPCILTEQWTGFIEWASHTFDLPVTCKFAEQGWGQLRARSPGVTVIDKNHFQDSFGDAEAVIELEVHNIHKYFQRAIASEATSITEPIVVTPTGGQHAALRSPQGILLALWQEGEQASKSEEPNAGPTHFTTEQFIKCSPSEAFNAITSAQSHEKFFVANSSRDFAANETTTWSLGPWTSDLQVVELVPNKYVSFIWQNQQVGYATRTQMNVLPEKDGTRITITESGWEGDTKGIYAAFGNCEGWTKFLTHLKFLMEHGIESKAF